MKDFFDQLDDRLRTMATQQHAAPRGAAPVPATPRPGRRRRPALLAGATASLAALGTIFALQGTSLADLPILTTPTTDATGVRNAAPAARKAGVDFSKAHAIGTPAGPGYVFTTPAAEVVCVTVPDPEETGRYGGACGPADTVERDGLQVELAGDLGRDPKATSTVVLVLPEGAASVRARTASGKVSRPTVQSGVVVAEIASRTTLSWSVDGEPSSRTFLGPFPPARGMQITCPDGRVLIVPAPTRPDASIDEAQRKACALAAAPLTILRTVRGAHPPARRPGLGDPGVASLRFSPASVDERPPVERVRATYRGDDEGIRHKSRAATRYLRGLSRRMRRLRRRPRPAPRSHVVSPPPP